MNRIVACAALAVLAACDSYTESAPSPSASQPVPREDHDVRAPDPVAQVPLPPPRADEPASAPPALKQDPAATGFILERIVRQKIADLTGRESEFHRLERVKISGNRVSIDDLTFGRRLVIRPDLGLAWVIDLLDATYTEVPFEALAKRRAIVIAELRSAHRRVEGSSDAGLLGDTLLRLGELPDGMPVTVRATDKVEKIGGRNLTGREIRIGEGISYINVIVDPELEGALGYFDALAKLGAYHPAVAERLGQLGGFPVRGDVRYAMFFDLIKSTEEVTSSARANLADAEFDRPANLKKVPLRALEPASWTPPPKPKDFQRSFTEDEIDRERNPFRDEKK
jgi:hypothetical protein